MTPMAAQQKVGLKAGNKTSQAAKDGKKTAFGAFASVEEFAKHALGEIVEATKATNAFPQAAARDLYCAYPTFGRVIEQQSHRILGLISKVLKNENVKGNIQRRQPDEQFEMLLECNDTILERLNCNLDEMSGIKKNPETVVIETRLSNSNTPAKNGAGSWNLKRNNDTSPVVARLITAKNIPRSQLKFKTPVDNSASSPFVPRLKYKPNSLKPLAILPEYDDDGNVESYLHPYEFELMKFEAPEAQLRRREPQKPEPLDATKYIYVDNASQLPAVVDELKKHQEIAIDVEHHSYRTFLGFTCLIQISTRDKDYLFDTIELRDELHVLNEVFTDTKIVKIFHGADSDIEWLQRDLSLYVVNMFDTHQAAKALNFARLSLSYLLKHYCDIEADKTFQLADWRMRPLPEELVSYARQDTHYLIYIYERITNDLLDASNQQTNLLRTIYQRSTELCKKRYVKPVVRTDSHLDFFRKSKRIFDNRQLYALREIFKWRDAVARMEDESVGYVLPNHMILQIAESLPREMQGILACCNPIPPLVRQHLHALHQIILRAREQPLVKPIFEIDSMHRVANASDKDINSKLHCPHDLSHSEEFRDDLPTLLKFDNENDEADGECPKQTQPLVVKEVKMATPKMSVFLGAESVNDDEAAQQKARLRSVQFISPYQRYLAVLPLVEKEKLEEAKRLEEENKMRQLCPAADVLQLKNESADVKEEPDDLYSLPVKEFLKRKYDEAMASKAENNSSPKAKRVKSEATSPATPKTTTTTPDENKLKFVNLPPTKREKREAAAAAAALKSQENDAAVVVVDSSDSEGPEEMPSTSQANAANTNHVQQNQNQNANKRNQMNNNRKGKFNKRGKFGKQAKSQSSDKPVMENFDYKNVDFKKFKGGAQHAKGTEIKPQFHGKGNPNKAANKKLNKIFTFSNVKGKKK